MIVLGLGIYSFRAAMKRNTAITFRDVLAILDVKPKRFFKGKRSDFSIAKTFASGKSSAFGARHLPWRESNLYDA